MVPATNLSRTDIVLETQYSILPALCKVTRVCSAAGRVTPHPACSCRQCFSRSRSSPSGLSAEKKSPEFSWYASGILIVACDRSIRWNLLNARLSESVAFSTKIRRIRKVSRESRLSNRLAARHFSYVLLRNIGDNFKMCMFLSRLHCSSFPGSRLFCLWKIV